MWHFLEIRDEDCGLATPNTYKEADHGQAKPDWVSVHADPSPTSGLV